MAQALLQLFRWALPQQSAYVRKLCTLPSAIAIKYSLFGDKAELLDGMERLVFYRTFIANQTLVWDQQAFRDRLDQQRDKLANSAQHISQLLSRILEQHHAIQRQLASPANPLRQFTYNDIGQQLIALFVAHWLIAIPYQELLAYPHFLRAIELRLERLQGNIERDHQGIRIVDQHWQRYATLQARSRLLREARERILEYRWMIEEFRVFWFAPQLKPRYAVSESRLEKFYQQHLAGL
jgi:ATP-dependent helicase HrpA